MDMSTTVAPKSSQLNADDLVTGPRTITITKVSGTGNGDQPVAVSFEEDGGKPYLPCKTMRRVMIEAWGVNTVEYVGRSMTLYRDPSVAFGGMQVGGIRIGAMSHIARELSTSVTLTKAKRAPFKVQPLRIEPPASQQPQQPAPSKADTLADKIVAAFEACTDIAAVEEAAARAREPMDKLGQLPDQKPFQRADAARSAAYQKHMRPPVDAEEFQPGDAFEGEVA